MTKIVLTEFSGIAPKVASRNLPQANAQIADNCQLMSGGLGAFMDKLQITSNALRSGGDVKTIFRMNDGVQDYWLSWITDVNCVKSLIAGDTTQRIYWTGDGEPRISNLAMAIAGGGVMPNSQFVLGVASPLVAPTVAAVGGSGTASSRAYVETFVTPWGEEGAPSPVSSVISGFVNSTWNITALNAAPINTAAISGASYAGGLVTVLCASTAYLRAGEQVTHAGVVGMTDLNGTFTIASIVDATHYTVALTTAQTYTSGGTWTRVAPHNTTGMTRRLYRTYNGQYYFVVELPIATTSYNDAVLDANLGNVIPSIGWSMPPATLKGLAAHPNGFMFGFDGNKFCASVLWRPHAWPSAYQLASNFEIVAAGVFGATIVLGTKGVPYIITGSDPSGLTMEKTEINAPCLSKPSMVDVGIGVMYSSPNGMQFVGATGADLATKTLFSKDEWLPLNPATMRCNWHNNMVFGWHTADAGKHTGFVFNPDTGAFGSLSLVITASYVDPETNNLYLVSGGQLYQWDAHPYNHLTFDWKSKAFSFTRALNFGYAMVDADFTQVDNINSANAADIAWNTAVLSSGITDGEFGDTMLDEYMLDGSLLRGGGFASYANRGLSLAVYGDGVLRYNDTIKNTNSFSLPSGYKANVWEFRLSGNIDTFLFAVAESASEFSQ